MACLLQHRAIIEAIRTVPVSRQRRVSDNHACCEIKPNTGALAVEGFVLILGKEMVADDAGFVPRQELVSRTV